MLRRLLILCALCALFAAAPASAASCPGAGSCPYSSDTLLDAPAPSTVRLPYGVGVDPTNGDAVVADTLDNRITAFKQADGAVSSGPVSTFGSAQTFNSPRDVAVDASGNRYVLDVLGGRVDVLSPTGTLLLTFGDTGNGPLGQGNGIAIDTASHVYVADSTNNRIVRFTVSITSESGTSGNSFTQDYSFNDAGMGQTLSDPSAVAVDGQNVYVANEFGGRIDYYVASSSGATLQASWDGSDGNNPQFSSPAGVAVDAAAGRLFVSDESNYVYEYQINGSGSAATLSYVTRFGGNLNASTLTTLLGPANLAVDPVDHKLFAADNIGSDVAQFSYSPTSSTVTLDRLVGHPGAGQLIEPYGIATDQANHLWVADTFGDRVQELNGDGSSVHLWPLSTSSQFGTYPYEPQGIAVTPDGGTLFVSNANAYASGNVDLLRYTVSNGQLGAPTALTEPSGSGVVNVVGLALDGSGHLFAADAGNSRILVYDTAGNYLFSFSTGSSNAPVGVADGGAGKLYVTEQAGQAHVVRYDVDFNAKTATLDSAFQPPSNVFTPSGVVFDAASGHLFVADGGTSTMHELSDTGADLGDWGGFGSGPGEFRGPAGVALDSSGNLFIVDQGNSQLHETQFSGSSGGGSSSNPCPAGAEASDPASITAEAATGTPGHLDPTFGWSGTAANGGGQKTGSGFTFQPHFGGASRPFGIAQQPNGDLVEAGCSKAGGAFGLTRYYESNGGGPDLSFSFEPSAGSGHAWAGGVAIDTSQGDVRPIAAGAVNDGTAFGAVRYLHTETADTSWGGGLALAAFPGHSALAVTHALLDGGKLVVVGYGKNDSTGADEWLLARFTSTGALDQSFGSGGMVATPWGGGGQAQSIVRDGSDYLVGGSGDTGRFALAKYRVSDGSLDTGFDQDGKVTTALGTLDQSGNPSDAARGLALDPLNGDILLGGSIDNASRLAVVRFHDSGSFVWSEALDTSSLGTQLTSDVQSAGVVVRPDGETVIAGSGNPSDPTSNQVLLGGFDESGNQDFVSETSIGANAIAHDLLLDTTQDPAGKVVVAGDTEKPRGSDKGFFVARFVAGAKPTPTGAKPQVTGTTTEKQTLSATTGGWNDCGPGLCTYHYQWQHCSSGCSTIQGASDSPTYTLRHIDVGYDINVCVSATNETADSTTNVCSDQVGPVSGIAPDVTTGTATPSSDRAQLTLTGSANAESESTTYYFQYSVNSDLAGAHPSSDPSLYGEAPQTEPGADFGFSDGGVHPVPAATISGLHADRQYYYRLVASNRWGTSYGTILALPYVTTDGQPSPAPDSDHLNVSGHINPGSLPTKWYFQYSVNSDMSGANPSSDPSLYGEGPFREPGSDLGASDTISHLVGTTLPAGWSGNGPPQLRPVTLYYYRLVAANAAGATFGPTQSTRTRAVPPPPFTVQGIQVSQAVQTTIQEPGATSTINDPGIPFGHPFDDYSGVELADGGKTIARVFVRGDGGPRPRVLLYGYGGDGSSLGNPLDPVNSDGSLSSDPPETKVDAPAGSFDFVLPDSWTSGTIRLVAVAIPSDEARADACATCQSQNALEVGGVKFTKLNPIRIRLLALKEGDNFPSDPLGTLDTAEKFLPEPLSRYTQVAPSRDAAATYVDSIDISDITDKGVVTTQCNRSGRNCRQVLTPYKDKASEGGTILNRVEDWDAKNYTTPGADMTIAITDRTNVGISQQGPIFSPLTCGASSCVDPRPVAVARADDRPLSEMAHEMGHGLLNASVKDHSFTDVGCAPGQEDQVGQALEPGNTQGVVYGDGLNRYHQESDGAFSLAGTRTNRFFDWMSYCSNSLDASSWPNKGNVWVAAEQWDAIINRLAASNGAPPLPRVAVQDAAAHGPVLGVRGFLAGADAQLDTVTPGAATAVDGSPSGYRVIGRNASGRPVVNVRAFAQAAHVDHVGGLTMLSANVPAAGVASLQLRDPSGRVLATRVRPAKRPRLRLLTLRRRTTVNRDVTLRWRARSPAKLFATVSYSTDGRHWVTIFTGPSRGRVRIPLSELAPSRSARLRVSVNDGFNVKSVVTARLRVR